mmetsp:Transcript_11199/g.30131  ORF Transcript_11199/g.30131 Transcript_11199/m.30131 type:complete len:313 (-) Transcript_11199:987-1925(-)
MTDVSRGSGEEGAGDRASEDALAQEVAIRHAGYRICMLEGSRWMPDGDCTGLYVRARVSRKQARFHPVARIEPSSERVKFADVSLRRDVDDREFIQYVEDGAHFCAKRALLVGLLNPRVATVVVTPDLELYRTVAKSQIFFENDTFLEIGCANGVTVHAVAAHTPCARAVGVDKCAERIREALQEHAHPRATFVRLDVLDLDPAILLQRLLSALPERKNTAIADTAPFSHVFIDINGNRAVKDVQRVVRLVISMLKPRMIAVKSSKWAERAAPETRPRRCAVDDDDRGLGRCTKFQPDAIQWWGLRDSGSTS